MPETKALWCQRGGTDGPLLVLMHGLGANSMVWEPFKPMLAARWRGRWLMPDFRGHGRSSHCSPYSIERHASDVAQLLAGEEAPMLVGHSMGGLVAIALASGAFGVRPGRAFAFGVKTGWSDEELARARSIADAPVKHFDTRAQAVDRYLRVSGLQGLIAAESPIALAGVAEHEGRFRLVADPRTNFVGEPRIDAIAAAVRSPVHLYCGQNDPITSCEGMKRLGPTVTPLPGLGHNAHLEAPDVLWREIERSFAGG